MQIIIYMYSDSKLGTYLKPDLKRNMHRQYIDVFD